VSNTDQKTPTEDRAKQMNEKEQTMAILKKLHACKMLLLTKSDALFFLNTTPSHTQKHRKQLLFGWTSQQVRKK
jgi:hypothetical protein